MLLAVAALLVPGILPAQLTTGILEGVLRPPGGEARAGIEIVVTGATGFRTAVRTDARGEFTLVLPYGRYEVSGVPVTIAPLQTTQVELAGASSDAMLVPQAPGTWRDATRGRVYPEPFSLQGVLLNREPEFVTEPLDFTGVGDIRLPVASQRALSWTGTQYRLHGIDATDSYQPGRPMIVPQLEALDEVVVRSGFAQAPSRAYGTEVGMFLVQPEPSWHAALATTGTGSFLSSSNLPRPEARGRVQQSERFRWFTRDTVEVGGPLAKWADFFASAGGQWATQTVPLAAPGSDQRSRFLFANARGRIRAGAGDQLDGFYSGSRLDLSDWAVPAGLEAFSGHRMAPRLVLPTGFAGALEVDHFDLIQAGWTHQLGRASDSGAIQVRYGYSTAHLDALQTAHGTASRLSRIELLDGTTAGALPIENSAVRTRHGMEASWQPGRLRTAGLEHQFAAGGGWSIATPRNRFNAPFNFNPITAGGVPSFVVQYNTPFSSRQSVRSFSIYAVDRVALAPALSIEAGAVADLARGRVDGETRISWNSLSPRAGFAWRVPHARGLVLRGSYFRVYAPLAGRYLDYGSANSLSGREYRWIDRNADGWFQLDERGILVARFGGAYSSIAPSLGRPYSDEFDVGAELPLTRRTAASIHLFRRDEKNRLAAVNVGVPADAFSPVAILDPGPDGETGTFDDQQLTVYEQHPATFGQDRYLLTNPRGLRELHAGVVARVRTGFRGLAVDLSFVAEKAHGPTNPGDAPFENDPGVVGALYSDPNSTVYAAGRSFLDRAYAGKVQAAYRLPWGGIELSSVAVYMDGLAFARHLLVTGLAQGPIVVATTVRGSPEGGNRAEYVVNWNLRARRDFHLPVGRLSGSVDVLNVMNSASRIQEDDLSGPEFNLRLPVAIQPPRVVRLGLRYEF